MASTRFLAPKLAYNAERRVDQLAVYHALASLRLGQSPNGIHLAIGPNSIGDRRHAYPRSGGEHE